MQIMPTIYKKTSANKIQIWFAEIDGGKYRTTSGQLDGKKTTTEWTITIPKNIGRSNELSAEQQAEAEVEAEYSKKLARDYHLSVDNIHTQMRFKPMLATKWSDRKDKIEDKFVIVQPKLDGVRCIVSKEGMHTREGKVIYGAPHIAEALAPLFENYPNLIFDGELYNHDLKDDFNKIVSIVKKQTPTAAQLEESANTVQYWIYDLPSCKDKCQIRLDTIFEPFVQTIGKVPDMVEVVENMFVPIDMVDTAAAAYIEQGFEGAMVRLPHTEYENKRSNNLIKWKEFQDEEFTIIDIQEGTGNRSGMAARVVCVLPNGNTFAAGLIGNVDYCILLLTNKDQHIGKQGTVVFQNYTPDGVPRFPKFKGVRFDV
jgi:DNA ligase-1